VDPNLSIYIFCSAERILLSGDTTRARFPQDGPTTGGKGDVDIDEMGADILGITTLVAGIGVIVCATGVLGCIDGTRFSAFTTGTDGDGVGRTALTSETFVLTAGVTGGDDSGADFFTVKSLETTKSLKAKTYSFSSTVTRIGSPILISAPSPALTRSFATYPPSWASKAMDALSV